MLKLDSLEVWTTFLSRKYRGLSSTTLM